MPLSAKQMEYLALAWQCFETEPKIDYDKFKDLAGLASANSARELMRVTKNKLKTEYGALGAGLQATNSNNNTPTKATGSAKKNATTPGSKRTGKKARDEVDDEESPSKTMKKEKSAEADGIS